MSTSDSQTRFAHPEKREDEFYLGNFTREEFSSVGYKTKRAGFVGYDSSGNPIPPPESILDMEDYGFPGFVKKDEVKNYNQEVYHKMLKAEEEGRCPWLD